MVLTIACCQVLLNVAPHSKRNVRRRPISHIHTVHGSIIPVPQAFRIFQFAKNLLHRIVTMLQRSNLAGQDSHIQIVHQRIIPVL